MPLRLGPAGVPLSCKGRTIVEGMDDITALGLETMEIQTVRTVAPHHFDQYWQAGILSWKTDFEMNLHGPYYAEILGDKRERSRTLSKMEASLQAAKIINARHITYHVGPYGEYNRGPEANEQVANVMAGVVDRCAQIWNNEDEAEDYAAFPWVIDNSPTLIGVETSGILKRFVDRVPERMEPASGPGSVCGVVIDVDETSGLSRSIERVRVDEN